jgi:hypothetical protein
VSLLTKLEDEAYPPHLYSDEKPPERIPSKKQALYQLIELVVANADTRPKKNKKL